MKNLRGIPYKVRPNRLRFHACKAEHWLGTNQMLSDFIYAHTHIYIKHNSVQVFPFQGKRGRWAQFDDGYSFIYLEVVHSAS